MRMHVLSGGRLRMRRRVYYPEAAPDETFDLPVICILLKHRQGNVLFDTGCHPAVATDAEARWGGMVKFMTPIFRPEDTVVHQLGHAGLAVDDIDVVVCSHLHTDHCGCNSFFPRATIYCHAAELAAAEADDAVARGYRRADWDPGRPLVTFDAQHDVFGDGRMTLLPMPGHTPGMTIAHVTLDQGAFVLASDAVSVRRNLDDRHAPKTSWDIDRARAALEEIARLERAGATVVCGHDEAQWRALRTGADYYA